MNIFDLTAIRKRKVVWSIKYDKYNKCSCNGIKTYYIIFVDSLKRKRFSVISFSKILLKIEYRKGLIKIERVTSS